MNSNPLISAKPGAPRADTREPDEDRPPPIPDTLAILPLRNTVLEDPGRLADLLASSLTLDIAQKQDLLEELDIVKRVRAVLLRVSAQLEIAQLQQKIQKDVAAHFTDAQRHAFLREQLKTIQKELGEGEEGGEQQIGELRRRLEEARPPKEVMDQADRELKRLSHLHPASPEFSVIVSYVETLAELPWSKLTEDNLDLDRAQQILDRDHFDPETPTSTSMCPLAPCPKMARPQASPCSPPSPRSSATAPCAPMSQ